MLTTEELQKLQNNDDLENWPKNEFEMIWKLVKRQRILNRLIKEIYYEGGIFSFHNMEMAVANLARIESNEFAQANLERSEANKFAKEVSEVWWKRYLGIRYKGLIRPYRILLPKRHNDD